ncbi:hypothetical protein PCK1_002561 [Pneumocystis canis]|nr:hypothetical protein PCK1_002561 [Pneumocystis canis]
MFWKPKSIVEEGDVAILWLTREQVISIVIERGKILHNQFGSYAHSDMIGLPYGSQIPSSNGTGYLHILKPTPELWIQALKHRTQIVYVHDISCVQSKLRIQRGISVLEAGTGSGSMTHALARGVGPTGQVFSYEYHQKRYLDALNEFKQNQILSPEGPVILCYQDVMIDGFNIDDHKVIIEAAFLDLPAPWNVIDKLIPHFSQKKQSRICCFNPCIEQVQKTLKYLRKHGFHDIELLEISYCQWIARKTELKDISEAADRIYEVQENRKNGKLIMEPVTTPPQTPLQMSTHNAGPGPSRSSPNKSVISSPRRLTQRTNPPIQTRSTYLDHEDFSNAIYVGNLEMTISNDALMKIFGRFGTIESVYRPPIHTDKADRTTHFAFIKYTDSEAAQRAMQQADNILLGRRRFYPIPKPRCGSASGKGYRKLIFNEDQKEYQKAIKYQERKKEIDLLDPDYIPDILTGKRNVPRYNVVIGMGKRNPNEKVRLR